MKDGSTQSLLKLLQPCSPEEFIRTSWGKTHKHVEGWRGKFAELLPWNQLNQILAEHRLDFPRLRLARDGKSLPASSYLRYARNSRQRASIPRLLSNELITELRAGATLVLDAVDELTSPLRSLAEHLEYVFREHVQINAYAGWHTARGFDLHFDDHDVFILQVAGRKMWKLYGMTSPHPLNEDRTTIEKPDMPPLWEQTLNDGDLLYIPRGWWHVAEPLDEPTLHLTVGLHNRTGLDLLRWTADRMKKNAAFRKDLPRLASASERETHVRELKSAFDEAWDERVLDRFLEDYDAMAEPRPHLDLPASVTSKSFIPSDETRVRLNAPRPLKYMCEDGVLTFSTNKKRWRFAGQTIPIFRMLEDKQVRSVKELCEAVKGSIDAQALRTLIGELIFHGLIVVADS